MTGPAKRLGIFGGTFDPIHLGHIQVAEAVSAALHLDRMLVVVANHPWQKQDRPITPAEDRFAMVVAALRDRPTLEASRIEIDRGGPSYTADTLEAVVAAEPGAQLYTVVGADAADAIETWERVDAVSRLSTLVVVNRPGSVRHARLEGWRVIEIEVPALEVSSTDLRSRAADGRPLDYLVPDSVVRVIRSRGLYAGGR